LNPASYRWALKEGRGEPVAQPRNRRRHEARCRIADGANQSSSSVARAALFLGIFSTLLSIASTVFTFYRTSPAGEVKVVKPLSGYALVRGINPEGVQMGPWSPDHIVLPLEWSNGTGSPVLIKSPRLLLSELGENGKPTGEQLEFFLVGELPEASIMVSDNLNTIAHNFTNSIVVEPHSVKQSVSVFRVNNWDAENKCLRFHQGQNYQVALDYDRIPQDPTVSLIDKWLKWLKWLPILGSRGETTPQPLVDNLPILESANDLSLYGEDYLGWDYYSLLPGSRASRAEDLKEVWNKEDGDFADCS
jgi:hypothetical protein